jgi:1,4-alpha-glucan branching enzyme
MFTPSVDIPSPSARHLLVGIRPEAVEALVRGSHSDPHGILGAHPLGDELVVRAFHPDAVEAWLLLPQGAPLAMARVHPGGIFACVVGGARLPLPYRLGFRFEDGETWEREDPYRFLPTLGEMDLHLVGEGRHYNLHEKLGAHLRSVDGVDGVSFAVWAPNAARVSVVGAFNRWDGRLFPMRSMGGSGIWEIFVPGIGTGELYKFEIKTQDGHLRMKTDPFAFAMEMRPGSASRVWDRGRYQWGDREWMEDRPKDAGLRSLPMSIYEVHLGSWRRAHEEGDRWLTYREAAPLLVEHVKRYGFTHIQLLPVMEHPFDGSWGYQVTGYFAPTSRHGSPDDLRFLIDTFHQNGIGVILDWVPAHFPKDDYSLRWFDGSALYEHEDPRLGEHRDWGTLIFNFGRNEVRNFLVSNALYWLEQFHADGLRVDAVASMLYLDYSRQEGEWLPNQYGGRENLEAIAFLKELNEVIYGRVPGVFTVAEESTAWPGVSMPTYLGGLGFGFKWNMGWMHDTLDYFRKEPVHRSFHHNRLTFSMIYAYSENFILPLSHDEVVHGKGSLLGKMPGDEWQRFANVRLLLAYFFAHPGKKLLFMGTELAPWTEWDHDAGLEWFLDQYPPHAGVGRLLEDLGALYRKESALWAWDADPRGFAWIDCNDSSQSVLSLIRRGPRGELICLFNFTPVPRHGYRVGVPFAGDYAEILNTDSALYGGSDLGNGGLVRASAIPCHGHSYSLSLTLPPLAGLILRREGERG